MQVQFDADRHIGADDLAHAGEVLTFAILDPRNHHRSVQTEHDAIHAVGAQGFSQVLQGQRHLTLELLAHDRTRGLGERTHRGGQCDVVRFCGGEESAVHGPGSPEAFEDLGASSVAGEAKSVFIRRHLGERVRLVVDASGKETQRH